MSQAPQQIRSVLAAYETEADDLFGRYESVTFEAVHADWQDLLPAVPSRVLDIGAGSGRDATWLAGQGHRVVAVEPVAGLRLRAAEAHPGLGIVWLDDRLPKLAGVQALGQRFDLILLSAVWIHVVPTDRMEVLGQLVLLLVPGGRLVITLRLGPPPPGRPMYPVSVEELVEQATAKGLEVLRVTGSDDQLGRETVRWQTVCLQRPIGDTVAG